MIINEDYLAGKTITGNRTKYIIKKHHNGSSDAIKLSKVFDELPAGLIHKEETGIGATYLELTAKRNSIIVEPIKITASSKAFFHNALYIGSPTKFHSTKNDYKAVLAYLNDNNIPYKKIIAVADSLRRAIAPFRDRVFKDFFLLIDEIDSFQMDSSFRSSMESVMDIYKEFPADKRAMVSATTLSFSDPVLAKEPISHICYDEPTSRTIELFYSENIRGASVVKLNELLNANPSDKIMVAYNSVTGSLDIAEYLVKTDIIQEHEISILCSANSKSKVKNYYTELQGDKLPARLTFVTSAYFTGFDLKERYHLLSISGNSNPIHSLSDSRLKQIAGRCREGLLSETVIYDRVPYYLEYDTRDATQLIREATIEINALDCIKNNFQSDTVLSQTYDRIRSLVINYTQSHGYKFVREYKSGDEAISYLNIDAYIERNRVGRELYYETNVLEKVLQDAGHNVTEGMIETDISVESLDVNEDERKIQVTSIVESLQNLEEGKEPLDLLKQPDVTKFQADFINSYHYLYRSIDNAQLLTLMAKEAVRRDNRGFTNLMLAAFFFSMHPDDHYNRIVNFHLPLKSVFTNEQLLEKWNDIFLEMNMQKKLTSEVSAVRLTALHFLTTKRRDNKPPRKTIGHYIRRENPYDLTLIAHKPIVNNQTQINFFLQSLF